MLLVGTRSKNTSRSDCYYYLIISLALSYYIYIWLLLFQQLC
uniref:Uncharacterized protein n=1 Tax=Heterorhabditis bacteriophora TaxID=37862 RepID=A0A1I7W7U6_HETBA